MKESISIITATADRPVAIKLVEEMMRSQTVQDYRWIVSDDGDVPATLTMGQTHLQHRRGNVTPVWSMCRNLLAAIAHIEAEPQTDLVAIIENDDWYGPHHLEDVISRLSRCDITGDQRQRYYNLRTQQWCDLKNVGACLAQTAFRIEMLPRVKNAVLECQRVDARGVDAWIWQHAIPTVRCDLYDYGHCVGIKGLPGRAGIGAGHRPGEFVNLGWSHDPSGAKLSEWVGAEWKDRYWQISGHE